MIARDAVAGEDAQQRIVERQVEARRARVALAARAAAQLVVDAARLVALGADDVQAARGDDLVVQRLPFVAQRLRRCALLCRRLERLVRLDAAAICFSTLPPSTMSVPRPAMLVAIVIIFGRPACATISASRACCLAFSTWCGSLSFCQHARQQLGVLDRRRADQHRLAALVAVLDVVDDRLVFSSRGLDRPGRCGPCGSSAGASGSRPFPGRRSPGTRRLRCRPCRSCRRACRTCGSSSGR